MIQLMVNLVRGVSKVTATVVIAIILIAIAAGVSYYAGKQAAGTTTITKTVTSTLTSATTKTVTVTKTVTAGATTSPTPTTTAVTKTVVKTTTTAVTTTVTSVTAITKTATATVVKTVTPAKKGALHTTVIYLIQNDANTRVMTIKKGVADFGVVPLEQIDAVAGTTRDGFKIVKEERGLSFDIVFIVFNCLKKPFNNVLVRQALAYATPYKMIKETVYKGYLASLVGVIPKGMLGWTDYGVIDYKFDMAKAKELIKKSGIDPSKYTITIYYNQGNTQRAKIATLLSTYWGQLGFKVMVQALSWPQLLERIEKPEFDVYIIGWAPDYVDPDDYAGPLVGGQTKFDSVRIYEISSPADVAKYLSSAKVIDVGKYYVVVGPAGTGAKVSVSGKPIIVVQYKLSAKQIPPEKCEAFNTIDPAFYRNTTLDALIEAGRYETNPVIRAAIYNAVEIISNHEVPLIWLGQYKIVRVYWDWVKDRYINPVLGERWDLIWEVPPPRALPIGIGNYKNDQHTLVIATIGWPHSFDPAKSYETFGWQIFHQIGDTLVTYWKEDLTHVVPDAAVAWAHNKEGTEWFFVIRGGLKAYDPWHNKVYDVNATDVLFTIWRIARLRLDPSWMIFTFIDVNKSTVYTESEFDELLKKTTLYADFGGKTYKVTSLSQLLSIFGYNGKTAGVVMLKLYHPYAAILNVLADPFTMVIPAKYLFDNVEQLKGKYLEAMNAAKWGKDPAAWAKYIGTGNKEPTHLYLHTHPVGTGPYYVADFKQNSYIVLKINPYYWDKALWKQLYGYSG